MQTRPRGISFSSENQHVAVPKDKSPPPRPALRVEGNGDGGGSAASDRWSKELCEINKEKLAHPTPNFPSFTLGNGSSPKRGIARASLRRGAGPEHPPPAPRGKANRLPADNPPPCLNTAKTRGEDFAHIAPKNEATAQVCSSAAPVAFARRKSWRNLGENPWGNGAANGGLVPPVPVPVGTRRGSRGWFREWEAAGRRKPAAPAWDGLFEQTKSSGLFPPAPTQWKEFPAPAPGWKS